MDIGSDIFDKGMVYVALSRVRSLKGLFLTSFSPSKIQVHESVVEEYCRLKELLQNNTNDHDQCKCKLLYFISMLHYFESMMKITNLCVQPWL